MWKLLVPRTHKKKSQLTAELFYKDEAGNMDETVIAAVEGHAPNVGLQKRRTLTAESKEFDMMCRIHGDIFCFQEKYLLNEVGMKIKLIRSNDNFCLMSAADTKTRRNARFAVCAQSKTVAIGVPFARKESGNCHGQVSYKTHRV